MSIDVTSLEMQISKLRMLVVGSINRDVFLRMDRFPADDGSAEISRIDEDAGGHGGNCAARAAHLGVKVFLMGAVGNDKPGSMLIEGLNRAGVDTSLVHVDDALATGTVFIPQANDRQFMLMHRGANDSPTACRALIQRLNIGEFDVVVLMDPSRYLLGAILRNLAGRGRVMLIWAPGGLWASRPEFANQRNIADVIIVNRPEFSVAFHGASILSDTQLPNVIVTEGSLGVRLHKRGGGMFDVPAFAVKSVDPTGAGDAFIAAYGAVANLDCLTPLEQLQIASMAGALATEARGARGGLYSAGALLTHVKRALLS